MKVILLKDVDNIGSMGAEINVKDGYARNFLIPRKLAIESTPGAVRILEDKRREKAVREKKLKQECEAFAKKISGLSCTIAAESGEEDKLFGSVTSEIISESLKAEGIEIDKKKIIMEEPIKKLGVYNIEIKLHPEVKTQIRIWIIKK